MCQSSRKRASLIFGTRTIAEPLQPSCSVRGPMEALESLKISYSSGRQASRAWKRTSASEKSREISRSLEKSHIWPENVSWTRSGQENLKKNPDYLAPGADTLQPSSQRASLACDKANTRFKPRVFRRPGHPPIQSLFYVMSCSLQPRSLHPPFFGE